MGDSAQHALLSPSGASRWLTCTPSVRLEQQFPDSAGDAAREGTLAHAISENMLRYQTGRITEAEYKLNFTQLKIVDAGEFYNAAMQEYCEQYVTFVMEQFAEAQVHTPDAQIHIERRLDISAYAQDCFGTGDVGIVADTKLKGIDLKYGKGVEVSAIDNKQMKLYALGWLKEFDMEYDITEVEMTIFQPRMDNYSTWSITVAELKQWAETELKVKAALAFSGKGDFVPGQHCGFCKLRDFCKAKADYEWELHQYNRADAIFLNPEQIAAILDRAPNLVKWANGVAEYALAEAVKGKQWPGFKLVEGRSNRTFKNEDAVIKALKSKGWSEDHIYNKKLLSLGDLENLLGGKKAFNEVLGLHVIKPAGKPTLVKDGDRRPQYSVAASAFRDFEEDYVDTIADDSDML